MLAFMNTKIDETNYDQKMDEARIILKEMRLKMMDIFKEGSCSKSETSCSGVETCFTTTFSEFMKSINKALLDYNSCVAGSAAMYLFDNTLKTPNDVDIWTSQTSTRPMIEFLQSLGWFTKNTFMLNRDVKNISPDIRGITTFGHQDYPFDVQLIETHKQNPVDIIQGFDLNVVTIPWNGAKFIGSIKNKKAIKARVATFSPRPWDFMVSSECKLVLTKRALNRIVKYRNKGFKIQMDPKSGITIETVDKWISEMSKEDKENNTGYYCIGEEGSLNREICDVLKYRKLLLKGEGAKGMFKKFATEHEKSLGQYIPRLTMDINKHFFEMETLGDFVRKLTYSWWMYSNHDLGEKPLPVYLWYSFETPSPENLCDDISNFVDMHDLPIRKAFELYKDVIEKNFPEGTNLVFKIPDKFMEGVDVQNIIDKVNNAIEEEIVSMVKSEYKKGGEVLKNIEKRLSEFETKDISSLVNHIETLVYFGDEKIFHTDHGIKLLVDRFKKN